MGLPTNGEYYRRLAASFKRVFASTIFFGIRDKLCGSEIWDRSRVHFLDHARLWFSKETDTDAGRRENLVTLSALFREELRTHPIPVDTEVVRVLANNPGCLDLYTWLTWRCYQAKGWERIPLFGPFGLAAQLGVQEYARDRKFRERIRNWRKLVPFTCLTARLSGRMTEGFSNWHMARRSAEPRGNRRLNDDLVHEIAID